jgi:hypothetical protein
MSWFPGWDSIAWTGWWSGFFFWASIGSLMLLGASEVISHRYSERKDELAEIQQIVDKKAHDDEIARLHLDTAQITERAARLEKEAAEARRDAAQARLEQERLRAQLAWRTISPEATTRLQTILAKNPGKINVQHVANDPEALYLAIQIANIFGQAKWQVQMLAMTMAGTVVFGLWIPESEASDLTNVRDAFRAVRTSFSTDKLPPAGISFGGAFPDAPIVFVGSKPIPQ